MFSTEEKYCKGEKYVKKHAMKSSENIHEIDWNIQFFNPCFIILQILSILFYYLSSLSFIRHLQYVVKVIGCIT